MNKRWNWIKICAGFLCLALTLSLAPPALAAEQGDAGYRVTTEYDETANTLTASVYLHGVNAAGGHFALGFAPDQLALPSPIRYIRDAAIRGQRIELNTEGKNVSQYFSQERGHAMLAWYPYGAPLKASSGEYLLAKVVFTLQPGVTPEDFHSRTLYLYSVAGGYLDWDAGAWIRDDQSQDYCTCVAGIEPCAVEFDYPGADKPAPDLREVRISAKDSAGSVLRGGTVTVDQYTLDTDRNGDAIFHLADGLYTCMLTAPGYEDKTALVEVDGGTVLRAVQLRSLQSLVDDVADAVEIGYQGDDSAESVTRDIYLSTKGAQNTTIRWTTGDPLRLSPNGNVFRQKTAADVTLTATVEKDGRTAVRTFQLHITAADVRPTDPTPISPVIPGEEPPEQIWQEEAPTEQPTAKLPFLDLSPVASWAGEAITVMYEEGLIKGVTKTTFQPKSPVTRADFVILLMRTLQPEVAPGPGFPDVQKQAYYAEDVARAQSLGIIKGDDKGNFNPRAQITRQDMAVMTSRALQKLGWPLETQYGAQMLAACSDAAQVAPYARSACESMMASGYLNGRGKAFAPRANTTRAEAAVFLYRIFQETTGGTAG